MRCIRFYSFSLFITGCMLTSCGKEPPTSKAPPTLTNVNIQELQKESEDIDEIEEDDFDDKPKRKSGPILNPRFSDDSTSSKANPSEKRKSGGVTRPHSQNFAPTINGHPKGPKAEVFNGIINSSFRRINQCFANQINKLRTGKNSIQVKLTISNSGSVKETSVVAGINNSAVRSCVVETLRSLSFPAYEGNEVKQIVPFTFVRR